MENKSYYTHTESILITWIPHMPIFLFTKIICNLKINICNTSVITHGHVNAQNGENFELPEVHIPN